MWRLIYADGPNAGEILRENFNDQWEALKTAVKADGSRYKKADALNLPSGSTVYKSITKRIVIKHDEIVSYGKVHDKKETRILDVPQRNKFILEKYN